MSTEHSVTIRFEGLEAADAGMAAESLSEALLELGLPGVSNTVEKESSGTMDLGSTIVLVFGTQAAIELAKGIHAWLKSRGDQNTELKMVVGENVLIATGKAAIGIDTAKTAEAMKTAPPPQVKAKKNKRTTE